MRRFCEVKNRYHEHMDFYVHLLLIVAAMLAGGCSRAPHYDFSGPTMGTAFRVQAYCAEPVANIQSRVEKVLGEVNAQMSTYLEDSELSRFNDAEVGVWVPVSAELAQVVETARMFSEISAGAFDVTVGSLVNLWGFGPGGAAGLPQPEAIEDARARVGYRHLEVRISPPALRKKAALYVDLSAIAKGHGVDRLAEELMASGCPSYLVDIGGEVRAGSSKPDGRPWRIGVEVPDPEHIGGVQRIVVLDQLAVATSGDYRNFIEQNNKRYSHTIDPRTGGPVTHNLASVTVLARSTTSADALATLLNVLGPDRGFALAEEQDIAALFIIRTQAGFEERTSSAFEPFVANK